MNTVVKVVAARDRRRRRHSEQFRAEVVKACRQPGVSIAAVALANGLNANLVRRWVVALEQQGQSVATVETTATAETREAAAEFVPMQLAMARPAVDIRIELRRGATAITVTWPTAGAAECAAWMRELLR